MTAIVLRPCPFCAGPPVLYCEDVIDPEAFVFCHECGAQGPTFDRTFENGGYLMTVAQCRVEAARLWNLSDRRHADLYEVGLSTIDEATGERVQLSNGDT